MSASIETLMRRAYVYRGGRKSRRAYRRLVVAANRTPWLYVSSAAAAYGKIAQFYMADVSLGEASQPEGEAGR